MSTCIHQHQARPGLGWDGDALSDLLGCVRHRQRLLVNRPLDGFEGKLTTSKRAQMAKCPQDTALCDIDDPIAKGVLLRDPAGGRRTSYSLAPSAP